MFGFFRRFFTIRCNICGKKLVDTDDFKGISHAVCVACQQTLPGYIPQHVREPEVTTFPPIHYNKAEVVIVDPIFNEALDQQIAKPKSRIVEVPQQEQSELTKAVKGLLWKQQQQKPNKKPQIKKK